MTKLFIATFDYDDIQGQDLIIGIQEIIEVGSFSSFRSRSGILIYHCKSCLYSSIQRNSVLYINIWFDEKDKSDSRFFN